MSRTPITAYPNFADAAVAYVTGLDPVTKQPTWNDTSVGNPLLFSVTQETPDGNHNDSKNWIGPDADYMGDYVYPTDLGTWLTMDLADGVLTLAEMIGGSFNPITGWPLAFGHTFAGLNDLSISPYATLDRSIAVEFDIKITRLPAASPAGAPFAGARVILGAEITWPENGRKNTQHYFEVDLIQTPGYGPSLQGMTGPGCDDQPYDSCFYDPQGRWPEGRYVPLTFNGSPPLHVGAGWQRVAYDWSAVCRMLGWISPPLDWRQASVGGMYLAVEGIGRQHTAIKVKNWNPTVQGLLA